MPPRLSKLPITVLLIALPLTAPLYAQPSASPSDTAYVGLPPGTALQVGALIQTDVFLARTHAVDGFSVNTARLRLGGAVRHVRFFVQPDLTRSPALLDVRLRLPVSSRLTATAGRYKAPFSREALTSSMHLHYLNRARVVNALAPSRQIGASLGATLVPGRLHLEGGLYNGNGSTSWQNDNDAFLYVGRLVGTLPLDEGALEVGANAGYSRDANVALPSRTASFSGRRTLLGLDATLTWDAWLFEVEWITASLDPTNGSAYRPTGYHVTAGYLLAPRHQLLLRVDGFDTDLGTSDEDEQLLVGYNLFWTDVLKLQANYVAPLDTPDDGYVGVRLQLGIN